VRFFFSRFACSALLLKREFPSPLRLFSPLGSFMDLNWAAEFVFPTLGAFLYPWVDTLTFGALPRTCFPHYPNMHIGYRRGGLPFSAVQVP